MGGPQPGDLYVDGYLTGQHPQLMVSIGRHTVDLLCAIVAGGATLQTFSRRDNRHEPFMQRHFS